MTLQSSGIISLNDIYDEAVASGDYVGARSIQDLRDSDNVVWTPAVPQAPAVISLNDFYGCAAAYAHPDLDLEVQIVNNTGNVLTLADTAINQDWFTFQVFQDDTITATDVVNRHGSQTGLTIASGATMSFSEVVRLPWDTKEFNFRLFVDNSGEFSACSILLSRSPFTPVTFTPVATNYSAIGAFGWEAVDKPNAHNYDYGIFNFNGAGTITATIKFTFT
jgi:hypothetical protein